MPNKKHPKSTKQKRNGKRMYNHTTRYILPTNCITNKLEKNLANIDIKIITNTF